MFCRIIFLFLISVFAHAQDLFFEDPEPTLCHNVNVITGQLHIDTTDDLLKGPVDVALKRTYVNAFVLQRLKDHRLWTLEGRWNLFPQLRLFVRRAHNRHDTTAYLTEPSGITYRYTYDHREGHDTYILKGKELQQYLKLDIVFEKATLFLPSGGERLYQKRGYQDYLLTKETLPSGHLLIYTYNKRDVLEKIELQNPHGSKTFSWLKFDVLNKHPPHSLSLRTSDEKQFYYNMKNHQGTYLLENLYSLHCSKQEFTYNDKQLLETFSLEGELQFKAYYDRPKNRGKPRKKTATNPHFDQDKVQRIEGPLGTGQSHGTLASFSYEDGITDVRDADTILTRYRYSKQNLDKIEYYDQHDQLYAFQQLSWEKKLLKKKALHHPNTDLIIAKTFDHDAFDNIKEEVLQGNLTGTAEEASETFRKTYEYLPKFNVKTVETEEDGPSYRYFYLPRTNLLTAKLTYEGSQIILREFFLYDHDHLLITHILDDGSFPNHEDTSRVTERHITRYTHHTNGLVKTSSQFYWEEGNEVLLKHSEYHYTNNQLTEEKVFDSNATYRYSLLMSYDAHGNLISKTDPLGQTSTYRFNSKDQLEEEKEIGRPLRALSYDAAGRLCQTVLNSKEAQVLYDGKGRAKVKKDHQGNTTHYHYDAFSRCTQTTLPRIADETAETYTPVIEYHYSVQGYLALEKDPRGATTQQFYTAYGKPYRIIHPNGTETHHTYNKNSTLAKTLLPDGTTIHYTYDILQRKIAQKTYSPQEELLSEESWTYNAFHLTSYTSPQGLKTHYIYDKAGRKIREESEERRALFSYDALGFLESISDGCTKQVQLHDLAGNIVQEWVEDTTGTIENKTRFTYQDNRKVKAYRTTSQGETQDLFTYDQEGRLTTHTDPDHHKTQFIYTDTTKTTIDALGNQTIQTYDAVNRLISVEKKDAAENTYAKEQIFYDRSSNKAHILTTLFEGHTPIKTLSTQFRYNLMGELITQIDSAGKTTTFDYFPLENKTLKTLPDKTTLTTLYDGLGRIKELQSSDNTLHYTYSYTPQTTEFNDLISNQRVLRTYNPFGDLIEESSGLSWKYDAQGRCTELVLPDHSSIHYIYDGMHMSRVCRYNPEGNFTYEHVYSQFDPNGHVAEEKMIHNLGTLVTQHDHFERTTAQSSPYLSYSIHYGPTHLIATTQNTLFGKKTFTYDPLNQLQTENDHSYAFDSLGNCKDWEHSDALELTKTTTDQLEYDLNGNPQKRNTPTGTHLYHYDPLGRLIAIQTPEKTIRYTYDPLSRLYSKQINNSSPIFYIYDQEKEIGTLREGKIQELKILGLGIQGEIGAAIALELSSDVFAPLHDIAGNIIAIVDHNGTLAESYHLNAFGKENDPSPKRTPWRKENDPSPKRNPWRFSSKRTEETGLIYFGHRFYAPDLERWLTPDPSGYVEGINLYLYTLNNPLNRLDLFGLLSEERFGMSRVEIPIADVSGDKANWARCEIYYGMAEGQNVTFIIGCGYWHLLKFTPNELASGIFNLYEHFHDLIPKEEEKKMISLIHPKHGVSNTPKDCLDMCQMMYDAIPERTLLIGFYSPNERLSKELHRVYREKQGEITDRIQIEKTFLEGMTEFMNTKAQGNHILGCAHSEGGLVLARGVELVPDSKKEHVQQTYLSIGLGSASPLSNKVVKQAIDFYSTQDFITSWFALPHLKNPDYDIRFVKSLSKWSERSFYFADHAVNGTTYTKAYQEGIAELKRFKYRFYDGQNR